MTTRIVRRNRTTIESHPISQQRLLTFFDGQEIFAINESLKPEIKISFNAEGRPDVKLIQLGIKHDHYASWIHFDLKELLWQITSPYDPQSEFGYSEEYYYSLYRFKIAFENIDTQEQFGWEFDGRFFKIPKEITRKVGRYKIALIIQELRDDETQGNIPDSYTTSRETFVSDSWQGVVTDSIFYPELLNIDAIQIETDQSKGLIKPPLDMALADDGFLTYLSEDKLVFGVENDNFVRYIRFNPGKITAHLDEFKVYAIFRSSDNTYNVSIFERTNPNDPGDDHTQPLIAWIPTDVMQHPGMCRLSIVAVTKNYSPDQEYNPENLEDFYRFVSSELIGRVTPNFIDDSVFETEESARTFYDSTVLTDDETVLVTSDNAILEGEEYGN